MTSKIHWGILSTAMINDVVINAINNSTRSELDAIASRDLKKAKEYARQRNIPKAYGSYQELLDDQSIDVVYISVPNLLHAEWIVRAATAGKHVMCEKPIVTTIEGFNKIESAADKRNVVIFEAFMYLHHPQTLRVKEIISSGTLGKISLISSWLEYYLPEDDTGNIRLNKSLAGGSLWDVGVYPNSLSITLANTAAQPGPPVEAFAVTNYEGAEVDTSVYGHLKFKNNIFAQISVSIRTPFREGAYIVGKEGFIYVEHPWKPGLNGKKTQIVLTNKNDKKEIFSFQGISPYLSEVMAMECCIIDGDEPVVPLSYSRMFLKSVLALKKSGEKGKSVSL